MHPIPYEVVDVFTNTPFGGNPLAVIPDARGLAPDVMQRLAAEFGYSETTFVFPPASPGHSAQVRIFTPVAEVPFAGHPNVGTAFVLARRSALFGQTAGDAMIFEEQAGLVPVRIERRDGVVSGATITAPQKLAIGPEVPADVVAGCASLAVDAIALDRHSPLVLSVGLPFAFAEVSSRQALAQARPNRERFVAADSMVPMVGGFSLFLYVRDAAQPHHLYARMFAPLDNVPEDPATGSASAALAAYLVTRRPEPNADVMLTIEQGEDMGRPSHLRLPVTKRNGAVEQVSVGGDCVSVMRGELLV